MSRLPYLVERLSARAPQEVRDATRREAAVALLLVPEPDRFLVIARAEREGDPWSGHLACPGGRREAGDRTLLETASRETIEEVGVDLRGSTRVWQLDDLAPATPSLPPLVVRPFVFLLEDEPHVSTNAEVARFAWVTFRQLVEDSPLQEAEIAVGGQSRRVSGYRLADGLLWGITERIVTPLVELWRLGGER